MKPLSYGSRVQPETARQDKIELAVEWRVVGQPSQLEAFIQALSNDPASSTDEGDYSLPARLFGKPNGTRRSVVKLPIGKGGRGQGAKIGAPLFAGSLNAYHTGSLPGAEGRLLRLNLSINPTRFVAHQRFPGRDPFIPPADWGPASMRTRRLVLRPTHEASLDSKDNVLLGTRMLSFGRPEVWHEHLRRYWKGLLALLEGEFIDAAESTGVQVAFAGQLNLKTVETYWEFGSDDPLGLLWDITPALTSQGIDATVRDYPRRKDWLAETSYIGNSRSVTVKIAAGVWLRAYAKTSRRIRFEVRHDLRKSADAIGGRHTCDTHEALYDWLDRLSLDAATRLNTNLTMLEGQQRPPSYSLRPYNLIMRVLGACRDAKVAETILAALLTNEVIRVLPGDPLRPIVENLVKAEVLERLGDTRNPTRYVVTAPFRYTLVELKGQQPTTSHVDGPLSVRPIITPKEPSSA